MYYSLIIDHRQQTAYSFSRPSPLSPVRKAIPVSTHSIASWEQRISAISTFTGVGIKMSRNTSFLQSSSLIHFADSLKGGYLNYMVRSFFVAYFFSHLPRLFDFFCMIYITMIKSFVFQNSLAFDASERFTALLISALDCLACTLEVMRLPQVADILEEVIYTKIYKDHFDCYCNLYGVISKKYAEYI